MSDFRKKPSKWLMHNSSGYPDFLFTILTYAMILLGVVSLTWIAFGIIAYAASDPANTEAALKVMDSMIYGLISLAGVIFGLAGSYTVRRYKKDDHYIQKKRLDMEVETYEKAQKQAQPQLPVQEGLRLVSNEEDI